ncbi:permease prefix domain 1-containing protein [Chloroflexota bacterium]
MATVLSHYLDNVRNNLRIDPSSEMEIISELKSHIEDRLQELREAGLSEEEATKDCLNLLGSAKLVARQIYETYSQGTWRQTLLASMPHLIFGFLFALNWWQHIGWLLLVLAAVISIAVYGWFHGKPAWLFPWLGCSLLPVVTAGLFLLYLPKGWSWLAILIYIPLALWLLYFITVQAIRKDWLFSSFMLLPLPIIISWFLILGAESRPIGFSVERLQNFAPWIGLSFLALATTAATFIRLKQRRLKIAILVTSGLLILTTVTCFTTGGPGLFILLILIVGMLGLFLTPALLEDRIRRNKQRLST